MSEKKCVETARIGCRVYLTSAEVDLMPGPRWRKYLIEVDVMAGGDLVGHAKHLASAAGGYLRAVTEVESVDGVLVNREEATECND